MIQIYKTGQRPSILYKSGQKKGTDKLTEATEQLIALYNSNVAAYQAGTKSFQFKQKLYAHPDIKNKLIEIQHGKCCFCESRITHIDYGDVEHFRPKAAYKQVETDDYQRPGYFWLAYDWNNLFLSCKICNQRHKANLFPLFDESSRISTSTDDIELEEAIFIHPENDNPEEHLTFEGAFIRPKNNSIRGEIAIQALGLTRSDLFENRYELFSKLDALKKTYEMIPDTIPEDVIRKVDILDLLKSELEKAFQKKHQYTNMMKANFGDFYTELIT